MAGWFLNQIQHLYRVERTCRTADLSDTLRGVTRACESQMILNRIEKALKVKVPHLLPNSQLGKAVLYALGQWGQLLRYAQDGHIEIDNNLVENAIRPTAVGKKNWLFIGRS